MTVHGRPSFPGERIKVDEDHKINSDRCTRGVEGRPREPARLPSSQKPEEVHPTPTVCLSGRQGIPVPGLPGYLGPVAGMAPTAEYPGLEEGAAFYHPVGRQQTPADEAESGGPLGRRPGMLPARHD